jgi:hypothetical protein
MPSIRVAIEVGPGRRVEFEREVDDLIDGQGNVINATQLRPMWNSLVGEISYWIRYGEPTEAKAAD